MRKVYNLELLRKLHLARFIYHNEDYAEVYVWYNGPTIKIYNYLGEEIGHSTIVNRETGADYSHDDIINPQDVDTTIDNIVSDLYKTSNEPIQ